MIPQRVPDPTSESIDAARVCSIAAKWGIAPRLVDGLVKMRGQIPFDVWIFSGARGRDQQTSISSTPFSRSTHADEDEHGCRRLATGVDVQPVSPAMRSNIFAAQMGAAAVHAGLRWGGGAAIDPSTGIPEGNERWHVDLGARPTR